ncbi:MAG: class I SAM-dependent methyltransferase [Actinobacteria bacterium]|nr:class I SAM-dependent methyltransferase [Actinomycetota bacterium]
MAFERMSATDYDRFMGRFSVPLAARFAEWVGVVAPARALDVGCGPGALTTVLAERLGAAAVCAVDPSPTFAAVAHDRCPGVDVRVGAAERLPFADAEFDIALAELVVHFLQDPASGVAEMTRVTSPGGIVAACVWDFENDRAPHAAFLRAVRDVRGPGNRPLRVGTRRGDLSALLSAAGCLAVAESELTVDASYTTFDEWWETHTLGVGSAADRLEGLDADGVSAVRRCALDLVGSGPIEVAATAWVSRGVAP